MGPRQQVVGEMVVVALLEEAHGRHFKRAVGHHFLADSLV
jgi:hypothetical protein